MSYNEIIGFPPATVNEGSSNDDDAVENLTQFSEISQG